MISRISFEELHAGAQLIWADKKTAKSVAMDASSILDQAEKRKPAFCCGRRATALVGGLFYLLSFREDNIVKQNEIADKLGTTDTTIRASYRKWLLAFPDLFTDVINKMAQDVNFKYFILVDLKKAHQQRTYRPYAAKSAPPTSEAL